MANTTPPDNEGIAGVDVDVLWSGFDGVLGNGDDVSYSATSNADGVWSVAGMPAGLLRVTIDLSTLPPGIVNYIDPDGGNDGISEVTVGAGATDLNQDFGFLGTASIGYLVWRDDNDNSIYDLGEALAGAGVDVIWAGPDGVFGNADDHTFSAVTDGNGDYTVGNLPAGNFRVNVLTATLPTGSTNTVDPDGASDSTSTLSLAVGEANVNQNFAYLVPAQATVASAGAGILPATGSTLLGQLMLGGLGLTFVGAGLVIGARPRFFARLFSALHLARA